MANLNIAVQVVANVGSAAQNLGGLRLSLTDLKSGLDLATQAFQGAQQVIDATVGPTVELATQQRDLARVTGMTAEEAGVMIQATDDMGVSYSSLQAAAEKLNKEGLSLNSENLRDLRADYQKITDPVERAKFATDKFGKSAGPEMQKALDLSNAEFETFITSAKTSALVLSGESVNAAREYEMAQDNMADAVESFNVIAGQELMPLLTDITNFTSQNLVPVITVAADTFGAYRTSVDQIVTIYQVLGDQLLVATGQMTAGEAATRAGALAWHDAALTETQLERAAYDASVALDAHERQALEATTATDDLVKVSYGQITATDLLEAATGRYSAAMLFKRASEGLSTESAIAMGVEMGVLDSKSLIAVSALDKLKEKYDTNRDGAIDATEAAAGYTRAVIDLHTGLSALPETTTTNVVTNFIVTGGSQVVGGAGSSVGGTGAVGFAAGGIATGPESGHWELLHGDEAVIPLAGGRVPVELSGGGQPIHFYFDLRGVGDPRAVEDAARRGTKEALREAGVKANVKLRTGGR